jgi:hypothetical protein
LFSYTRLERNAAKANSRLRALMRNDLTVIVAMEGNFDEAREKWRAALDVDGNSLPARLNLGLIEAEPGYARMENCGSETRRPSGEPESREIRKPKLEVRRATPAGSETLAEPGRPSVSTPAGSETLAEPGRPSVSTPAGSETLAEPGPRGAILRPRPLAEVDY